MANTYRFPSDINGMHGIFIKIYGANLSKPVSLIPEEMTSGVVSGVSGVVSGFAEGVVNEVKDFTYDLDFAKPEDILKNMNESKVGSVLSSVISGPSTTYEDDTKAYIFLPMPLDIGVNYNASWGGKRLRPLEYAIREGLEGRMDGEQAGRFLAAAGAKYLGEAALNTAGLLNTAYGVGAAMKKITNPYRELMYDSPSLRMFTFDWTLSPKNAKESEQIRNIIFWLKKSMHPQVSPDKSAEGNIWEYPDYVDITFVRSISEGTEETQQRNEYLFTIKKCAISNINVRYDNKFHISDGSPTAISFELQLMETELLTQDSFTNEKDSV